MKIACKYKTSSLKQPKIGVTHVLSHLCINTRESIDDRVVAPTNVPNIRGELRYRVQMAGLAGGIPVGVTKKRKY